MKKLLIIGLLVLCLAAALPVASATTTYNVTSFNDLYNISAAVHNNTSVTDIHINLINDIRINSSDLNSKTNTSLRYWFTNVTIDGKGNNLIVNANGQDFNTTIFSFAGGDVEIKNLTVRDSNISGAHALFGTNDALVIVSNDIIIENCKFYNITGSDGTTEGSRFIISSSLANNGSVKLNNFVYSGGNLALMSSGWSTREDHGFVTDNKRDGLVSNGYIENIYDAHEGLFWLHGFEMDNVTFMNNTCEHFLIDFHTPNVSTGSYYPHLLTISNVSMIDNTIYNSTTGSLIRFNASEALLLDSYFEGNKLQANSSGTFMSLISVAGSSTVICNLTIKHCTFVNHSIVGRTSYVYSGWNLQDNTINLEFNTFVNTSLESTRNFTKNEIYYGNLFVNSDEPVCSTLLDNYFESDYSKVFGSNKPALNGGKTKNIQLTSDDTNPALNKISAADYLTALGSSPSADKDQVGKKRIYGSAVDYGAVELHKNPILSIIDDWINGGKNNSQDKDGSGIFSKTKPSMIEFLFGDDPFLQRSKSLLYFIYSNYVKMDLPVISPAFQLLINGLEWES